MEQLKQRDTPPKRKRKFCPKKVVEQLGGPWEGLQRHHVDHGSKGDDDSMEDDEDEDEVLEEDNGSGQEEVEEEEEQHQWYPVWLIWEINFCDLKIVGFHVF